MVRPRTLLLWSGVAVIGWWVGAWELHGWVALGCCGMLWIGGAGVGDRFGALIIGGLLGSDAFYALSLALVGAFIVCWSRRLSPRHLPLYPFLSLGTAGMIALRVAQSHFTRIG